MWKKNNNNYAGNNVKSMAQIKINMCYYNQVQSLNQKLTRNLSIVISVVSDYIQGWAN